MAEITAQAVNEFRKTTGLGLMECKALLKEADGDVKKALTLAKEKHGKNAENRAGRATTAGRVEVYIHHDGKSGGLVEVNCETASWLVTTRSGPWPKPRSPGGRRQPDLRPS